MEFLALLAILELFRLLPVPFVQLAELAKLVVGLEAERGGGKGDGGEGDPFVAAQGGGLGFLADEGELCEGVLVLTGECQLERGEAWEGGCGSGGRTLSARVNEYTTWLVRCSW